MKIIEAMKRIKANKEKVADLHQKIAMNSAQLTIETSPYPDAKAKVTEWIQSCTDISQENVRLLCAIQRTNLATKVTIKLGTQDVTKTISEWVWRRREYAGVDLQTWSKLTDKNLREGQAPSSTGVPLEVKIIRNYDPELRDKNLEIYRSEPHLIDAALEVVNATTDLIEA